MNKKLLIALLVAALLLLATSVALAGTSGAQPVPDKATVTIRGAWAAARRVVEVVKESVSHKHSTSGSYESIGYPPPPITDPYPAPYPGPNPQPTLTETEQWMQECKAQGGTVVEVRPDVYECVMVIPTDAPTPAPTCDPLDPSCG